MTSDEAKNYLKNSEWGIAKDDHRTLYHSDFTYDICLHLSGDFPDEETKYAILIAIANILNTD